MITVVRSPLTVVCILVLVSVDVGVVMVAVSSIDVMRYTAWINATDLLLSGVSVCVDVSRRLCWWCWS